MSFITKNSFGYEINAANYELCVRGHKIEVKLDHNTYATLDVRCAAPKTNDTLDGFISDAEPLIPTLKSVDETPGKAVFVWENTSALWKKEYTLTCTYMRFTFHVKLIGSGAVDAIRYFSGDMESPDFVGSDYEFSEGFNPCIPYNYTEYYTFKASSGCHRPGILMIPPMLCYAFRCEGLSRRLGLGLCAERGEHNFLSFDYKVRNYGVFTSGFWLETDQAGHAVVDGEWTAPHILGLAGDDEYDVLRQYSDYYFASGIAKPSKNEIAPRFWYGPMVCGWIEQLTNGKQSCEEVYETLISKCKKYDIPLKALIVDDKWQEHYATDVADKNKFPDMRAFADRRHAEGISTILWFKLFDADGWDPEICTYELAGNQKIIKIDPSHPKFREEIKTMMHRILSSDEGCYDCDGLKIDFAFTNPSGRQVKTYSGKYGYELLYELQADIYEAAKAEKSYALINASPCHPYFASICDQGRLHDYLPYNRNTREDMSMRGKLFSIAMPGTILDTDNAGFNTNRDTMRWMLNQTAVGVPDLYCMSDSTSCKLSDDDFKAIGEIWREYSAIIDAKYGL